MADIDAGRIIEKLKLKLAEAELQAIIFESALEESQLREQELRNKLATCESNTIFGEGELKNMALEQVNYSQVVTLAPQAPPWSQAVITGGTSTVGQVQFGPFGGLSYFTSGAVSEAGDRFQLWTSGSLKEPTVFTVAGTLSNTAVSTLTSPPRFTPIVTVNLTPGTYLINWTVQLAGTVHGPDTNNFVLYNGLTQVAQSVNLGTPGIYPQVPRLVTVLAGNPFVQVQTYGDPGTSGSIYSAGIGNWFTFFNPAPQAVPVSGDTAVALPAPKSPRWLGTIGHVSGLVRGYTCPGGPESMSLLLRLPADYRTDALNPGRVVQVWRGGSCIWEGKLDEPSPGPDGWTVTAHGAGQYGADFAALYTTWNADDAVNQAISRGMRWANPGIGTPAGIWLGQQQDSGSQTVTAHMNLLVTGGGLLWQVTQGGASSVPASPWVLQVKPFTSDFNGNPLVKPDRILICSSPVSRTVHTDINTLIIRYQATADTPATGTAAAVAATFATVTVVNQASVSKHGPMEYYLDVSSAGVLTPSAVQTIGTNILSRFVRASFGGPFTAGPGQVRNTAGTPVDLGCDTAGLVYQVMVTDAPYGGEVAAAPLLFLSGAYSYDEDTRTATITPYQSVRDDIGSLISALYPAKFLLCLVRDLYPEK